MIRSAALESKAINARPRSSASADVGRPGWAVACCCEDTALAQALLQQADGVADREAFVSPPLEPADRGNILVGVQALIARAAVVASGIRIGAPTPGRWPGATPCAVQPRRCCRSADPTRGRPRQAQGRKRRSYHNHRTQLHMLPECFVQVAPTSWLHPKRSVPRVREYISLARSLYTVRTLATSFPVVFTGLSPSRHHRR